MVSKATKVDPIYNCLWIITLMVMALSSTGLSWGAPPTTIVSPHPELAGGAFGRALDVVGDINNDGITDFIAGAPGELIPPGGSTSDARGRAYVLSGADGTALRTHQGSADGDQFGFAVAGGGDFDGDGVPDYAVGAPNANPGTAFAGSAYVFSGADGSLLLQKDGTVANGFLGRSIDFIGNLPRDEAFGADTFDDVIIGQPVNLSNFNAARVFVVGYKIDATLAAVLEETEIVNNSFDKGFGFSVAAVGDFDDDGTADFAVGAPNSPDFANTFTSNRGRAYVYSGAGLAAGARTQLLSVAGNANNQRLGSAVAAAGNFDGIAGADVIVGEPGFDNAAATGANHGAITVHSSSGPLLRVEGYAPNHQFGGSVAAAGDIDSDGFDDVLAAGSAPSSVDFPGGEAFIFSGDAATASTESLQTTTRTLWRGSDSVTIGSGESFGAGLAGNVDLDDDGVADWLVGAATRGASALTAEGQIIFSKGVTFFPPPEPQNVAITTPTAGTLLNGAGIPYTANADNADEVEFFVNGISVGIDSSAPYAVNFDSRDFNNGNASLTIEARNGGGGATSAGPILVEVDNKSPILAITAPADAAVVGGAVDFTADANDPNGVTVVNFSAGGSLSFDDFDAPYATLLDTTLEPDGPLQLIVTAEDSLGNSGWVTVLVEVDNTEPTVTLTSHIENQFVSGTILLTANAADPHLDRVEFLVEGNVIATLGATVPCEAAFDTTTVPDGALALEVRAFDAAGNQAATDTTTILVDNTAPNKMFVRPSDGRTARNNIQVQVVATDGGSGIAQLQVFAGTTEILNTTQSSGSVVFDTRTVIDGPLEFVCIATDNAGNVAIDSVTVTVRNLVKLLWPSRLNLRSSGNGSPVRLYLLGASAPLLDPPTAHGFQLSYPGGFTVNATGGTGLLNGALIEVQFDRLELISAISQQFADPPRRLMLTIRADGQDIGTVRLQLRGR